MSNMDVISYNILLGTIGLIVGGFIGLNYSYNKYPMPYTKDTIDKKVLTAGIMGGIILNILLPFNLNYLIGCLLIGIPFGMRPGYGRIELYVSFIIASLIYILIHFL